ncbi:MAG: flagellar biosynthetic protein FliR [Candidatus Azotimanducaceae bacterium]|jgi:flagellar biosynthetic protein FliR
MGWMVSEAELLRMMSSFMLPLVRIGAFFMAMPIIGTRLVSLRVRAGLAAALAVAVSGSLPEMPVVDLLSLQSWVIIAEQVLIGVSMAFMIQVLFQVFILAGQMIAMQMGLGFASMVDPANGINVAIISSFYLNLTTLVFLAMDGHLVAIELMMESFYVMPVSTVWQFKGLSDMASVATWMFSSALFVALPAVSAILIINFAFGIMTRAAPQLNIFSLGFPFTMLMGLIIMWIGLSGFLPQYHSLVSEALLMMRIMFALPGS